MPTPSFSEEITPQCTESNARPRKRTAHGNISRTEFPQTQHFLITTVVGPPPSPRTETPCSQRYSQRISNQTKRNHDSVNTSPIPLPQTTAITCLSDPAPTYQLAILSQDQQAKRTRHTQDTLPSTRKRTRSQSESQQHVPLTQIIDTVALSSLIVIQPTEQPTNRQPNKRTTRSQITRHNDHAAQALTQIITPPTQHINTINPITYQIHNNPTFEISDHPALSSQRRPQRKRRCEILDIPHNLPSLNLTPLRTTHIQQELWTYKKDEAFSMTPTEAINTLYYADMDILHIDNWRFFIPKKRDRDDTPQRQKQYHIYCAPMNIERWALPLFLSVELVPKSSKTVVRSQVECASCEICSYHLGLKSPDLSPPF